MKQGVPVVLIALILLLLIVFRGVFTGGAEPESGPETGVSTGKSPGLDSDSDATSNASGSGSDGPDSGDGAATGSGSESSDGAPTAEAGRIDAESRSGGQPASESPASAQSGSASAGELGGGSTTGFVADSDDASATGAGPESGSRARAAAGADAEPDLETDSPIDASGRVSGTEPATDSSIDSGTGFKVDSEAQSEAQSGTPPDAAQPAAASAGLEQEARAYVRQLAAPSQPPVSLGDAEGFVGAGRALAPVEAQSAPADAAEPDAGPGPEPDAARPAESSGVGNTASPGPGDTATGVAASESSDPGADTPRSAEPGISDDVSPTTEAGASGEGDADIQQPAAGATAATIDSVGDPQAASGGTDPQAVASVDLPVSDEVSVTIAELLGAEEAVASDAVFYVHTVQPDDDQGIWGIVHHGIVRNFAAGVRVNRGGTRETYRVDIPEDADEIETRDTSSSFLGRLIYEKSKRSYVYNFETERLGRNPDLIFPGQEIVIISFTPEELVRIYKHFSRQESAGS